MNTGLYSALSGAVTEVKKLDVLANNLANVNDAGYKKDRLNFRCLLDRGTQNSMARGVNFRSIDSCRTDFSQGDFEETGRSLDLAIQGQGFFKVADESGFYYTRQGSFRVLSDGSLVTQNGEQVVGENGPVSLPDSNVDIRSNGRIYANGQQVGRISVYDFSDRSELQKHGDTLFRRNGAEEQVARNASIDQGFLERSNLSPMHSMVDMIESKRAFQAYQKAIKTFGDLAERANQIGRIG